MILDFLTPLLTAVYDRVRGGYPSEQMVGSPKPWWITWSGRLVKWVLYGGTLALQVTTDWRLILAAGVLFNMGERFGYQGLIGKVLQNRPQTDPHGWQIGILKKSMPLALLTRGALWALPVMPLTYFEPGLLAILPACMFGCLFSPYLVKYLPLPFTDVLQLVNKFPWQELVRGFLFGLLTVVFSTWVRS